MLVITSPRFGAHVTPPGHPERIERAEVFDRVAARWSASGGRTAEPRPATREELARVHGAAVSRPARGDRRPGGDARRRHLHVAGSHRGRAAGGRRGHQRGAITRSTPASRRSLSCGRRGIMPSAIGRWASASTTTSPSPRRTRSPAAWRASRSSTSTSIMATARSGSSTTIRASYTCPATSSRSIPGTGAADEIGHGAGAGFTVNMPLEAGATDADYARVYARGRAARSLAQFEPGARASCRPGSTRTSGIRWRRCG